jgi:valyl-tRNA synthetase
MRDIQDWCISRQLWWGHRIPAWYCEKHHVTVARETPTACATCGSEKLEQDPDVLDTWFSSALWPFSVFGWPQKTKDLERWYPTSVLVTGFDIIFFWVARMMFAGLHLMGEVPFRDVYIHALVRDQHGEKMSKTKGNVVDPLVVIDEWGADAFRFTLVAFAAQGRDVLWDPKRVEGNHRFITKIWSALKFCFLHAEGYDPQGAMDEGPYERWIRARTAEAVARVRQALDDYRFNEAASEIHAFVWGEFCDWYIELCKTTIYDPEATPAQKNAVRHTLFDTMGVIARLVHPVMPFLSEEIWSLLPQRSPASRATPGREGFVATAAYPRPDDFPRDAGVLAEVAELQDAITEVRRIRGEMQIAMKTPLELRLTDGRLYDLLRTHERAMWDLARSRVVQSEEVPKASATGVVRGRKLVIPLEGVVDVAAEVARLTKELAKVGKDKDQLDGRLANADFVAKAKAEFVAELRAKRDAAAAREAALNESLRRLTGGGE